MRGIGGRIALCLAFLALPGCAAATESLAPRGEVILTVSGKIKHPDAESGVRFDRAALEALDASRIVTTTPWTDGDQTFVGVDLLTLMQAVGATGDTLVVTALNDYQVSLPVSDLAAFHPILAYLKNGAPMPVSDKGPLFIVYPYASDPQLRNDVFYTRSAWQVVSIDVE